MSIKTKPGTRKFIPTPLKPLSPVPSDIEIAQSAILKPITQVAEELGLLPDELELYGNYKAKIKLSVLERLADVPDGKYIDVTAITPTLWGKAKQPRPSASAKHSAHIWGSVRWHAYANLRKVRPLASKAVLRAVVMLR